MAYNANDRVSPDDMGTVILRSYKAVLANQVPWLPTVMRNYSPWPANTRQIDIPILTSDLNRAQIAAAAQFARNANWATPTEDSVQYTRFIKDRRAQAARKIVDEDYDELPTVGVLEAHGRSMRREVELKENLDVKQLKFAGNSAADQTALAAEEGGEWPVGQTGAVEGDSTATSSNGNFFIHDDADAIDDQGAASGDAVSELQKTFDRYYLFAEDNGFGAEGETSFMRLCYMTPTVWVAVKNGLRDEDISEAYNTQLLEQARTVFGDKAVQVINGTTIVVTNDVPDWVTGTGNDAKTYHQVLFTTNRDIEYSPVKTLTTSIDPTTPPSLAANAVPTTGPMYAEWIREVYAMTAVDTRYNQIHRFLEG